MLSLFFGVGIGRILRYRSSNTSMVDSVSLPALFSGATALKDGTLRKKNYAEKQPGPGRRGFPADVRDPLDSALRPPQMQCPGRGFRTLRPLRGDTAGCYRPCGRLGGELDEMRYAVECLLRSIERLDAARLLSPERCAEALEAVRRMVAGLRERCAGPV